MHGTPLNSIVIEGMAWAPWLLIFPSILFIFHTKTRAAGFVGIGAGYAVAFLVGQLTPLAFATLGLLVASGYAVLRGPTLAYKVAGHAVFLLSAVALRLHVAPGFENPLAIHAVLSDGAVPFKAYLNLDKTITAVWIVVCFASLDLRGPIFKRAIFGAVIGIAAFAVLASIAVAIGTVRFEPKIPEAAWLWAINNILLVCFAEEVFFRGYVQAGLSRLLHGRRHADAIAILAVSLIFGFSHLGQPLSMQLLTVFAGAAYGVAYLRFGLIGAISAHAALNLCHFFLLTYPWLAYSPS